MSDYAEAVTVYRKSVAAAAKKVHNEESQPASSEKLRRKYRRTVEDAIAHFLAHLDTTPNESLKKIAQTLKDAYHFEEPTAAEAPLAGFLTEGRTYTREERIAMETSAKLKAFRARQGLLSESLTAPEVAKMLGTSRQTPHDRAKNGTLLAINEGNLLRFPLWQFDPDGPNGVIAGLPQVLRALKMSAYSKAVWLTRPHLALNGDCPLDWLRQGKVQRVLDAAHGAGATN